jgi:hypothetical protein
MMWVDLFHVCSIIEASEPGKLGRHRLDSFTRRERIIISDAVDFCKIELEVGREWEGFA